MSDQTQDESFERSHQNQDEGPPPVEVPLSALSPEALDNLIESFVLREGTDYGSSEVSLEAKTRQVLLQIQNGKVKIVFDPALESVTLVTAQEWRKMQSRMGSVNNEV